jgi:hypothetical protein
MLMYYFPNSTGFGPYCLIETPFVHILILSVQMNDFSSFSIHVQSPQYTEYFCSSRKFLHIFLESVNPAWETAFDLHSNILVLPTLEFHVL